MSLKQKTMTGIKWTGLSTIAGVAIQTLQVSILARFLDPADFGLMSLVMVVIGFSQAFLDMGISNAIIHKQVISKTQLSTLYWINVFAGFFIFCLLFFISPAVADFYGEPRLIDLINTVSLFFIVQPFGQQFMILLQKEMQFSKIALVDTLSKLVSLFVSSYLAYLGTGVSALVYGALSLVCVQTLLFFFIGQKNHRPEFVFRFKEVQAFLSFGMFQMGDKSINYLNLQVDAILIGRLLGVESLGIYSIAKQLVMKPAQVFNPIITRVTFPALSTIQEDIPRIRNIYLKTVHYLSLINFPIHAFIFIYASELLFLLFGPRWVEAAPVLRVLSVWAAFRSTGNPIGSLLLARGRVQRGFWWNLFVMLYTPIGIYVGSFWGIDGVVISLLILAFPVGYFLNWFFLVHPLCEAPLVLYSKKILNPFVLNMIIVIIMITFNMILDLGNIYLNLVLGTLVGSFVVFVLYKLFEPELFVEIRKVIKK